MIKVTVKKGDFVQAVKYYRTLNPFQALATARMEHHGPALTFRAESIRAEDQDSAQGHPCKA